MNFKIIPFWKFTYLHDYTFFSSICLTAKALRRITMRGFLAGATESEKRILKQVQLIFLDLGR